MFGAASDNSDKYRLSRFGLIILLKSALIKLANFILRTVRKSNYKSPEYEYL